MEAINIPRESESVEWKQSLGEWKEIVETCAAFATARGGTIYVGVTPDGTPSDVEIGKGTLEDLSNKIKLNTETPQFPIIEMAGEEPKTLLTIRLEESPIKPVWAFGRPAKRVGRTNQFLRRDEAHRLMTVTTGRTWDALPCEGFAEKDIDRKVVRDYLRRTGMKLSTPLGDLLKNLGMPKANSSLCNAAVLLFAKRPQSFLIETEVKCGRFEGIEPVNFIDERTFEGSLLSQLDESIAFVRRNTRQAIRITGSLKGKSYLSTRMMPCGRRLRAPFATAIMQAWERFRFGSLTTAWKSGTRAFCRRNYLLRHFTVSMHPIREIPGWHMLYTELV